MKTYLIFAPVAVLVAACTPSENVPLVFGQGITFGVSVGAAPTGQTPELTVGYKDVNLAIIPTVMHDGNGGDVLIGGVVNGEHGPATDAFSTFGQFEGTASGNSVGLSKFFATGLAAQKLADGFSCAVSEGTEQKCTGKGTAGGS